MKPTAATRRWLVAGFCVLAISLAACSGTKGAASHPSADAAGSSAAAAASAYASNPAVKAAEAKTETAALQCEQSTHANPFKASGRTKIGDCMAPAAVQASFKACRNAALAGVHIGASHPIMTFVNAITGCYVVVVLKEPLPQGLSLPAGFTAPATSASPSSMHASPTPSS